MINNNYINSDDNIFGAYIKDKNIDILQIKCSTYLYFNCQCHTCLSKIALSHLEGTDQMLYISLVQMSM